MNDPVIREMEEAIRRLRRAAHKRVDGGKVRKGLRELESKLTNLLKRRRPK